MKYKISSVALVMAATFAFAATVLADDYNDNTVNDYNNHDNKVIKKLKAIKCFPPHDHEHTAFNK